MQYAYGRNDHRLEARDFDPSYHRATSEQGRAGELIKQMPWILRGLKCVPDSVASRISPSLGLMVKLYSVSI